AVGLAECASLEEIAILLWRAEAEGNAADEPLPELSLDATVASGLIEACQIRLAALADKDLPALDLTRTGVIRTGWRIVRRLAGCVAEAPISCEPIHRRLAA